MKSRVSLFLFCTLLVFIKPGSEDASAQCNAGKEFQYVGTQVQPLPAPNDNCITLTDGINTGQTGCAWDINSTIDFTIDFSYDFKINLGSSDGGADGMCFVIHNDPNARCACGGTGGGMGAMGLQKSLIVEIDTYINTEDRDDGISGLNCTSGPDVDHMDIWLNGKVNQSVTSECPCGSATFSSCVANRVIPNAIPLKDAGGLNYNIENGLYHLLRVKWVASTKVLTVSILDNAGTVTYGTATYSGFTPSTLFGTNNPYFGFTASTGGLTNNQSFCLPSQFSIPLDILSFGVNAAEDGTVTVNWVTTGNSVNQYYLVERSADGKDWLVIGRENVKTTADSRIVYTTTDLKPLQPIAYYRLKSVDKVGKTDVSKIVRLRMDKQSNERFVSAIYPNPANSEVTFTMASEIAVNTDLHLKIINSFGQIVMQQSIPAASPGSETTVLTEQLAPGLYQCIFHADGYYQFEKLLIKR